jgi:hypothetical protein
MRASEKLLRGLLIGGAGSDSGAKPVESIHPSAWKGDSRKFPLAISSALLRPGTYGDA